MEHEEAYSLLTFEVFLVNSSKMRNGNLCWRTWNILSLDAYNVYFGFYFGNITISFVNSIFLVQVMTDRFNAPVLYCHNDLLSGNLMLNDNEGKFSCMFLLKIINSLPPSPFLISVCHISFGVCLHKLDCSTLKYLCSELHWIVQLMRVYPDVKK